MGDLMERQVFAFAISTPLGLVLLHNGADLWTIAGGTWVAAGIMLSLARIEQALRA